MDNSYLYLTIGFFVGMIFCVIFVVDVSIQYHKKKTNIDDLMIGILIGILVGMVVGVSWPISLPILVAFYVTYIWVNA